MILLFAEIFLTAYACVRLVQAGKSWVLGLIPITSAIAGGIVIGLIGRLISNNANLVICTGSILDFFVIGILIWICAANKPKTN